WQLHTMTRPAEASNARWAELDLEHAIWVIPAERMKKRKEHRVPLTPQMILILETMKPISGHREFIFPSDKDPKK
ncbi:tyrosine-type recombinase/integrase, partial [Vibrio sp. 10N.261.49.A5]